MLSSRSILILTSLVFGLTAPASPGFAQNNAYGLIHSSLLNSGLLHYDKSRRVVTMAPILETVTPGVVSINTIDSQTQGGEVSYGGIGSGVIIDADKGLIITNHHVIEDAQDITVILSDRRQFDGQVLGQDPDTDLALLQISAEALSALPFAKKDDLQVGDYVIAVGNPFGLSSTVTSGIVSAIGREGDMRTSYTDFIQTDASINPGNSGGALVNSNGELIGINSAIVSRSGGSSGIGFAVPLYIVRHVAEHLEKFGTVDRGTMGVMITPVPYYRSEALKLSSLEGALIAEVLPGGAGEKIGLRVDDVITRFAGRDIKDSSDLRYAVGLVPPGETSEIEFTRAGESQNDQLTIQHKTFARPVTYDVIINNNPDGSSVSFPEITPNRNVGPDIVLETGPDDLESNDPSLDKSVTDNVESQAQDITSQDVDIEGDIPSDIQSAPKS